MYFDSTPVHCSGQLAVLQHPMPVVWTDGSELVLHAVQWGGAPCLLLRALQVDGTWLLLDLQAALPELASDIRVSHTRDHQGLVWFTLRGRYLNAGLCLQALRPLLRPLPPTDGQWLATTPRRPRPMPMGALRVPTLADLHA